MIITEIENDLYEAMRPPKTDEATALLTIYSLIIAPSLENRGYWEPDSSEMQTAVEALTAAVRRQADA